MLQGCPIENDTTPNCEKEIICEDDRESYCDPPEEGSCVETCYYFVYEYCWPRCKNPEQTLLEQD